MTSTGSWALVGGELARGNDAKVTGFCDHQDRYMGSIGTWDLDSVVASVYPDDACSDAASVTVSGQPAVLCELTNQYGTWITAMAIVGPNFVTLQAQLADENTGLEDEIRALLESATLVVS